MTSERNCSSCRFKEESINHPTCHRCVFDRGNGNWSLWEAPSQEPQAALPENPKAIHGRAKPTLALIPGGAMIPMSRVFELGASKYGAFNWRKDPVEAETYVSAAQRHLLSWFDGEDIDPESGQPHIAHVACCMAILLDAASCGKLIDNRPHKGTSADLIRALTKPLETNA